MPCANSFFYAPLRKNTLRAAGFFALMALQTASASAEDPYQAAMRAVKANDFAQAVTLFEPLAQSDDHDAQYNLAILLKSGKGRPQHFTQALEWAWLSQLGGVERAQSLSEELAALVPPAQRDECLEKIGTHLEARLARGESVAVMQYVTYKSEILPKPDFQSAYVWSLIGAALDLQDAAQMRDQFAEDLDPKTIATAQDTARAMFQEQNMTALFRSQDDVDS